ncbi:hypothetical protein [Arthrobacter sp. TWP1-1]
MSLFEGLAGAWRGDLCDLDFGTRRDIGARRGDGLGVSAVA